MKIALGIITYNEIDMVSRLLPRYCAELSGLVVCDTGSTDGTVAFLKKSGAAVKVIPWVNFSVARNEVISLAESLGYDQLFTIDADEALLISQARLLKTLDPNKVYAFPRLEFADTRHIFSDLFPDLQVRLFPLRQGYHYQGAIHEVLYHGTDTDNCANLGKTVTIPYVSVFHYGRLKPLKEIALKYNNFDRTKAGVMRKNCLDPDFILSEMPHTIIEFHGDCPI